MQGMCRRMGLAADRHPWCQDLTKEVLKRIGDTEQGETRDAWSVHAATIAPNRK